MNLEDYLIFKGNKKADYYTNVSSLLWIDYSSTFLIITLLVALS